MYSHQVQAPAWPTLHSNINIMAGVCVHSSIKGVTDFTHILFNLLKPVKELQQTHYCILTVD